MIPLSDLIAASILMFGSIIAYVIRLERRLTRIETKLDTFLKVKEICPPT
jgi:hypothetical protein